MKQSSDLPLTFPKHFLWGAASSAHQIEGDNHNQWSVWELENAKVLAETAKYRAKYLPKWEAVAAQATTPQNYVSGRGGDHYHKYLEDFALLKKLNMNAWRFSIEWSRIEPEEGAWNPEAIEHYRTYLKKLAAIGIEPFVTLWHWTVPVWFEQKGGFTKRANVAYFTRFVEKVFGELGQYFRYVITLNEPEVYAAKSFLLGEWPPQIRSRVQCLCVLANLVTAHKKAYKIAKAKGRKYLVSIAKNTVHHTAGDDAKLTEATKSLQHWFDLLFLRLIRRHIDFVGLNYYFSHRYYGYRMHNRDTHLSDVGWDMQPANIEFVLKDLADRFGKPIVITENGVADQDDEYRKWWITQTLMAMHRALQNGVQVQGYLHWSLTDNFEWSSGFWPRFGLAAIDYKSRKRALRPSAVWFAKVIKRLQD